jgi:hypothetical protein
MPPNKPKFDNSYQHEKSLEREIAELENNLMRSRQHMVRVIDKLLLAPEDEVGSKIVTRKNNAAKHFSATIDHEHHY